jgi:di/tricarboxylate transporter
MVSVDTLVVFGLIAVALAFFVTETLPTDITAIGVLVSLVVLKPYTGVDTAAALQGFATAIVESATLLPLFAVVVVVYLLTGLLANLITPVASVVLLLPVGYQTNLMV